MTGGVTRWRKLGLVFRPATEHAWMQSHASTPTSEVLAGTMVRIYFTSRDASNRSHIGCVELDVRRPFRHKLVSTPLVRPGEPGLFDDSGAAMGCLVPDGSRRLLYYLGWNLAVTVPWRNSIGLAVADGDSLHFEKVSAAPVVDRSEADPYSLSYPWVLPEAGRWRMWYGSNLAWGATLKTMRHAIKLAESADGLSWTRTTEVSIAPEEAAGEFALSRPCVLRDGDCYRMWYSRRGQEYRIGYAESVDGRAWFRRDAEAGIAPEPGSFDDRSVEYPCVFDAGGERYMLYNGDDYGRAGFGLAIRER